MKAEEFIVGDLSLEEKMHIWMFRTGRRFKELAREVGISPSYLGLTYKTGRISEEYLEGFRKAGIPENLLPLPVKRPIGPRSPLRQPK